jgi:hypothetical protein
MRQKTKGQHGGYREGVGRPIELRGLLLRGRLTHREVYAVEPIVVKRFRHGQYRRVKTTRLSLILERLDYIGSGNYRAYRFAMNRFEKIGSAVTNKTARAQSGVIYRIGKELESKDPTYRSILRTIVPKRIPTPYRDPAEERKIAALKKMAREERRAEAAAKLSAAPCGYDDRGRRILPEKEWKTAMREGIAKHQEWTQRDTSKD